VEGARPYINLDNGASTPTFTPIWNAVYHTWRQPKQIQQEIIHEVKFICAKVLGAPLAFYDVIFTSNTTEAINLVAENLSRESEQSIESVVLNSFLEHNSNELPWRIVPHFSLIRLQVDPEGFIDLNELDTVLCAYNQKSQYGKKRIKLVAVSGASNVLGIFNNLLEISQIVHRYGARLLVDAAQLVAHRKVELELIQSSGEENAGGIAALGKALILLQKIGLDLIQEEEQALTERALRGLAQIADLQIYGVKNPDSPRFAQKGGVIVFSLKDIMADKVAKELVERRGIGVRSGCHCAHMLVKRLVNVSPLLERFQGLMLTLLPMINLPGIVRVSLGIENSKEDIDTLINVLDKITRQPRTQEHRPLASTDDGTPILSRRDVQQQMNDFARAAAQRVYT
jgi:selenocysteine lyase/cysteine desulfurase